MKIDKFVLVFIPIPGMGHLKSMVEMANILVTRDHRLTITILAINQPFDAKANEYIQSLSQSAFTNESIHLIFLPELPPSKESVPLFILENFKPHVREAVAKLTHHSSKVLAGFVIDMFCTTMTDVAKEFEVPCYVFFTSGAGYLAFSFHLQELYSQSGSNEVVEQLKNSDVEVVLPSFVNPIPSKVIPGVFLNNDFAIWLHDHAKRFRSEINGILINTFAEMEPHVIQSLSSGSVLQVPPIYSVGPILQLKNSSSGGGSDGTLDREDVLKWLDDQPPSSVLFLCFGSRGSFDKDQVEEIANGLERSGVRFVWSLRKPPTNGKFKVPTDYDNIKDSLLPDGFLDRTADIGRVIGWAPQEQILAHPATGGFVSHCGWNSTLESMWHGVPMATWPMYAEQQFNAFEMVVELGLAMKITIDYDIDNPKDKLTIVGAEEIETGIRKLMGEDSDEIRKKVKAKSEESRKCIREGGSSFISLGHFIDDVLANSCSKVENSK